VELELRRFSVTLSGVDFDLLSFDCCTLSAAEY
jgi:hypothetical protein